MRLSFFLRIVILLPAFLIAISAPHSVFAQSALDFLNDNQKVPQATQAQIEEAFGVYDECQSSDTINRFYDCDCLSSNFLELRRRLPKEQALVLLPTARKTCANTTNIAGDSYQYCLGWATQLRNDYDSYCKCYANAYAKNFKGNPSDSIRGREVLMTSALNSCSTGTEIAEKNALQNLIIFLKKQGIYKTLFPGADSATPEQAPPRK